MEIETTIIGAGIIGLAIAAELSEAHKDIFVLERNETFGLETSSRNSEVIHAGIYYPEGSLKARLCVEGNRLLYDICRARNIPFRRCGKMIVAVDEQEEEKLEEILARAKANGIEDIQRLSRRDIRQMEPQVHAVAGLHSPSTGIIDSRRLMRHFVAKAKRNRVNFVYHAKVERIDKLDEGRYDVHGAYPDGETFSFATRHLINCGGLESDILATSMGIDIAASGYEQHFWKGRYFSVDVGPEFIHRLVYPVPQPANVGLGIHATIDVRGRMRLGPDAEHLPDRSYDYTVDRSEQRAFFESVRRFLPSIRYEDMNPEMAGIRPKLQRPGDDVKDFVIQEETEKGFPGVVNLVGIESPGLTSCMAIAKAVRCKLG